MTSETRTIDIHSEGPSIRPAGGSPATAADERAFKEIARVLMLCEAGSFRVGIPWLPPTDRVRILRNQYEEPLLAFAKRELSTVATPNLSLYCQQLATLPFQPGSADELHINQLSRLERLAFPAVVFFVFFALTLSLTLPSHLLLSESLLLSFVLSLVSACYSATVTTDKHRRTTFHWLLNSELTRRCGGDSDSLAVPIAKADTVS